MHPLSTHTSFGKSLMIPAVLVLIQALSVLGADAPEAKPAAPKEDAHVFYLDGAGGGSLLVNWGREFKKGLRGTGANIGFENFTWQTGLGASADQAARVDYKRRQAGDLATKIVAYHAEHSGTPMHFVGFSAGSAVALYTLEALPETCQMESVVLIGSSVSAGYDLTRALQRVPDRMYVYSSQKDAVLKVLVPVSGTADREYAGRDVAGLCGFRYTPPNTLETKKRGGSLVHIPWRPEFKDIGNRGGHTDFVKERFVRAEIAPLFGKAPSAVAVAQAPVATK